MPSPPLYMFLPHLPKMDVHGSQAGKVNLGEIIKAAGYKEPRLLQKHP
jgi:hypothetical protein